MDTGYTLAALYSSYRVDALAQRSYSNAKQNAPHFQFAERNVMDVGHPVLESLGLDARELHHPTPLLGIVRNKFAELSRRAWKHRGA